MVVDSSPVGVCLHSPFQCLPGETNVVYTASPTGIVWTPKLVNYIGLLLVRSPGRSAVANDKRSSDMALQKTRRATAAFSSTGWTPRWMIFFTTVASSSYLDPYVGHSIISCVRVSNEFLYEFNI